jgi:hypothetical protein
MTIDGSDGYEMCLANGRHVIDIAHLKYRIYANIFANKNCREIHELGIATAN